MYVPDPAAVLRTQPGVLRSGGVIAPIEFDLHSERRSARTPSSNACPANWRPPRLFSLIQC